MHDRASVRVVVRATLVLLARVARRTRTPADDLMAAILNANEDRLVDAVLKLLGDSTQPPTDAQVVEALLSVGIQV